ncbi:FlgO family outer membrane protein [Pseudoalteromonas fenneropenaei]|uniref:FlgO family outer membrane protein n=1 Tax=Pseudoalteromonas fenneropenaei TaxID=1737459 RepID=A0ABV7CH72_9GAMM
MNQPHFKWLALLAVLSCLQACTITSEPVAKREPTAVATMAAYDLHSYVGVLAAQLSDLAGMVKTSERIAITSFYFTSGVDKALATGMGQGLSQQIQESLMTYFAQMGYQTTEYRLENAIVLHPSADSILTRDVTQLRARQNIGFVITGTLTEQQHAYVVNARLVNLHDGLVMSAATTEIPKNVMWSSERVQMREGTIYRTEY